MPPRRRGRAATPSSGRGASGTTARADPAPPTTHRQQGTLAGAFIESTAHELRAGRGSGLLYAPRAGDGGRSSVVEVPVSWASDGATATADSGGAAASWHDTRGLQAQLDAHARASTRRHAAHSSLLAASRRLCSGARAGFASVFLPRGYPHSVAPEYVTFQAWDTVQAMSSYLRGILATQAILEGVGVGSDTATPLAATIQWVLRDGASMMASLAFAWWGARRFDSHVKSWRLFADVINDVGLTLEMVAPLAGPQLFIYVACVGSVCKALCGVSAGSTRATLTEHFARDNNIADVAAKEGSQETAVTLLGLVSGMLFAQAVNQNATAVWTAFVLLTLLHVVANYRAVSALRLRSVNRARADIVIDACVRRAASASASGTAAGDGTSLQWSEVSPQTIGLREGVLPAPPRLLRTLCSRAASALPALGDIPSDAIHMGASLRALTPSAAVVASVRAAVGETGFALVMDASVQAGNASEGAGAGVSEGLPDEFVDAVASAASAHSDSSGGGVAHASVTVRGVSVVLGSACDASGELRAYVEARLVLAAIARAAARSSDGRTLVLELDGGVPPRSRGARERWRGAVADAVAVSARQCMPGLREIAAGVVAVFDPDAAHAPTGGAAGAGARDRGGGGSGPSVSADVPEWERWDPHKVLLGAEPHRVAFVGEHADKGP